MERRISQKSYEMNQHLLIRKFQLLPLTFQDIDGSLVTVWCEQLYRVYKVREVIFGTTGPLYVARPLCYISKSFYERLQKEAESMSIFLTSKDELDRDLASMIKNNKIEKPSRNLILKDY